VACSKTSDRNWHVSKDLQPVCTLRLQLADGAVHNIGDNIYLSGLSVLLVVVTNITAKYSSWKLSFKLYLRIRYAFRFILKIWRIKFWYRAEPVLFEFCMVGTCIEVIELFSFWSILNIGKIGLGLTIPLDTAQVDCHRLFQKLSCVEWLTRSFVTTYIFRRVRERNLRKVTELCNVWSLSVRAYGANCNSLYEFSLNLIMGTFAKIWWTFWSFDKIGLK